jgi:hypothetical protein
MEVESAETGLGIDTSRKDTKGHHGKDIRGEFLELSGEFGGLQGRWLENRDAKLCGPLFHRSRDHLPTAASWLVRSGYNGRDLEPVPN